jgi:plasmid stability protein
LVTVSIELSDEQTAVLKSKAHAMGVSAEEYARHILEENLETRPGPGASAVRRPISQVIAEIMADTPPEELRKLPADGASEHDHYIYGWPKRNG